MQNQLGIDGGAEARRGPTDRNLAPRLSYRPAPRRPAAPAPLSEDRLARLSKQLMALGEAVSRTVTGAEQRSQHEIGLLREELRRTQEALNRRLDRTDAAQAALQSELGRVADLLMERLGEAEQAAMDSLQALEARIAEVEATAEARQAEAAERLLQQLEESEVRTAERIAHALADRTGAPAASTSRLHARRPALLFAAGGVLVLLAIAAGAAVAWNLALRPRPAPAVRLRPSSPVQSAAPIVILRAPEVAAAPSPVAARPVAPRPKSRASVHPPAAPAPAQAKAAPAPPLPPQADKLRALAEHGDPRAALGMAELYAKGLGGVAKDPGQARRWKAIAAQAGYAPAMHNLGVDYLRGEDGPVDPAAAAQWFRMAADKGFVDSEFNLGVLYEVGQGVPRDLAQARKWYGKAAAAGDTGAADRLAALGQGPVAPPPPLLNHKPAAAPKDGAAIATNRAAAASAEVIEVQQKLARLGFYLGAIDGMPSAELNAAVDAYNKSQAGRQPN